MQSFADSQLMALIERWAASFGYYDGRINLRVDDLASFTTPDAVLTVHGPLWGTNEGEERVEPVAAVRKQLARMLKFSRVARHRMHATVHPDGELVGLFFVLKARIAFVPITVRTVPLLFVVRGSQTEHGLRISEVHEWAAADPAAAHQVLVERYDWPASVTFTPHVAFGAVS